MDLVNRLTIGIVGVSMWLKSILTKSPRSSKYAPGN